MSNLHTRSIHQSNIKRPDPHPSKESAEESLRAFMDNVMKARETHGVDCVLISAVADFIQENNLGSMGSVQIVGDELEAVALIENSVWSLECRHDLITKEQK